jgi:hypothetical protein
MLSHELVAAIQRDRERDIHRALTVHGHLRARRWTGRRSEASQHPPARPMAAVADPHPNAIR